MKTAYEYTRELMQKMKPSMAFDGGDLKTWQAEARKKVFELIGLDKFQKVEPDLQIEYENELENAIEIRFTYQSEAGYRVPCHLLLPKGVEKTACCNLLAGTF